MRLLMIATGYLPYLFSENLCNGKLVMALQEAGITVDVISRVDEGPSYGSDWSEPWDRLKPTANIISYKSGNKLHQIFDIAYSGIIMGGNFQPGIRWMRRAYHKALELMKKNEYDAILTRSPNDIPHIVGEKLKRKKDILWIANWNDPADPIWPGQYKHEYSEKVQIIKMAETERILRAADINSFPSDSLRKHFIEHFPFLSDSATAVFPHIGLCGKYWPKPAIISHNKLLFLHSGNLSVERNPENTFIALRKLVDSGFKNFEFHIMGHINEYTDGLITKYGLTKYVKCIGSYPYMEALSKMQSYDVLVLLEACVDKGIFFASKFTDYLQSGKPIFAISPKEGFAADMLKNQHGEYLADNLSVDSIFETLNAIVKNWENGELQNCSSNSLFKNLSSEEVAKSYCELIKQYSYNQ